MKFVKNNQSENIITENDITLTGKDYEGKVLSDVLSNIEKKTDKLESNVKWIYQYGGVGSGTGSGNNDSSQTTAWSSVVTLVTSGRVLTNGDNVSLSGPGSYEIGVQIRMGGTSTYRITFNFASNDGTSNGNVSTIVSADNSFYASRTLVLSKNGHLNITITNQDTQEQVIYGYDYIVQPYNINLYYVYCDNPNVKYSPNNNNIYNSDVASHGIMACLEYSFAVNLQKFEYTYAGWTDNATGSVTFSDDELNNFNNNASAKSGRIYFNLVSNDDNDSYDLTKAYLADNDNASLKTFTLTLDIQLQNNTLSEQLAPLVLSDNLIPSTLYLKVQTSAGTLYTIDPQTYPTYGLFNVGKSTFILTPYMGAYNSAATYELTTIVDGETINTGINKLSDQTATNVNVQINLKDATNVDKQKEVHTIQFIIVRDGVTYECIYYLYTRTVISNFNWYPSGISDDSAALSYYKSIGGQHMIDTALNGRQTSIVMSVNSSDVTYTFNNETLTDYSTYDQMLCIGIQYSEINDTTMPIATFNTADGTGAIQIYQDKIWIMTDSGGSHDECSIFLNKEINYDESNRSNFHLLTIYKRLEYSVGNNRHSGIYVYIDGVLTAALSKLSTTHVRYTSVTLHPSTYIVNLLESSHFERAIYSITDTDGSITVSDGELLKAKTWTTDTTTEQTGDHTYLDDNDITAYYMRYRNTILQIDSTENDVKLYETFSQYFKYDDDNFIVLNTSGTDIQPINAIAQIIDCPVLLIKHTNNYSTSTEGAEIPGYNVEGEDNLKNWMSDTFTENYNFKPLDVTLSYATNHSTLQDITTDSATDYVFTITPQGSSTLGYRCKNWELAIKQEQPDTTTSDNTSYVYSPNYSSTDGDTFLPEESFTLKADVVDSSHSNNNAMGAFINFITDKFDGSTQNNRYDSYIKKCLLGFPVLVFLQSTYDNKRLSEGAVAGTTTKTYFLGIYNFNMGRHSYHNLGYVDNRIFNSTPNDDTTSILKEGFHVYTIQSSTEVTTNVLSNVNVAEIQGNNSYFDFSQYDTSILFPLANSANDITYMWGDFVRHGNIDDEIKINVTDFVRKTALAGGYVFDTINKSYSTSSLDNYGYDDAYSAADSNGIPKNQVPNYRYQAVRSYAEGTTTLQYTYNQIADATETNFNQYIVDDEDDPNDIRRAAVNYKNLSEYYTICMAFGMVDSVQKNLNIKTWSANQQWIKWYLAFYDMDTCLGVSNSGNRISYFAFSDYWKFASGSGEPPTIEQCTVYRDYSPKETLDNTDDSQYYDTPSSYIFAIAKYASLVTDDTSILSNVITPYTPNNLWAKWRRNETDSNNHQIGCLKNADAFITNYYKHHLDTVPIFAFNSNYRYKYLVKNLTGAITTNISFDNTNFPKFYGRKLEYTTDWLNGRLHILDAYFNLNRVNEQMIGGTFAVVPSSEYIDTTNEDIYVLHDIFSSTSQGNQYAGLDTTGLQVSARPYAPLIIQSANYLRRYLFPSTTGTYVLNAYTSGNQYLLLGGSSLWSSINTINPFITQENKLFISSKYFENINGTAKTCNAWSFNLPALKTVSLTSPNYSGQLSFGTNNINLTSVNINNTSIQLSIDGSPTLQTVQATNMRGGSINIQNCPVLTSLSLSSYNDKTSMGNINISTWKSGTLTLPTTYTSRNTNTYLNCTNLTVSNDATLYPNATLIIHNNNALKSLTFSGFESVYIYECPKISNISINDRNNDILKTLSITPSDTTLASDTKLVTNNGTSFDVSNQKSLTNLIIKNTGIESIKVRQDDNHSLILNSGAFQNNVNLKYFSGSATINGNAIFYNCPNFTLYTDDTETEFADLTINSNLTDLTNMFYISDINIIGSIGLDAASHFLTKCIPETNNIKNVNNLFRNQNIVYGAKEFIEDYNNQTCRLSLANLKNCTTISCIFYKTYVGAINRYMFTGAFEKVSSVSWYCPFANRTYNSYVTEDTFADVITKISSWRGYSGGGSELQSGYIRVVNTIENDDGVKQLEYTTEQNTDDETGEITTTYTLKNKPIVSMNELFNPNGISPTHLTSLATIDFYSSTSTTNPCVLDFTDMFTDGWTDANNVGLSLSLFIWYRASYMAVRTGTLDNLFANIKIKYIHETLDTGNIYYRDIDDTTFDVTTPSETHRIDLWNMFDWENKMGLCTNLCEDPGDYLYGSLTFAKTVSYENFQKIWHIIISSSNIKTLSWLFYNCIITTELTANNFGEFKLLSDDDNELINTNIYLIDNLFRDCSLRNVNDLNTIIPFDITSDFLKCMPNITYARNAFRNTQMAHTIPFNFWRKRNEYTSTVYVDVSGSKIPAILHTYSYNKTMRRLTNVFYNVRLTDGSSFNPYASYNKDEFVLSYIDVPDYQDMEPTEYYLTNSDSAVLQQLTQPTEISDIFDYCKIVRNSSNIPINIEPKTLTLTATGSYTGSADLNATTMSVYMVDDETNNINLQNGNTVSNFVIHTNTIGPLISPDIFYALNYKSDDRNYIIVGALYGWYSGYQADSPYTFTGYMPANLLKECKEASLTNTFTNLNVLPIYYNYLTQLTTNGMPNINAYYTFIPANFTNTTSLDNAFKYKIRAPRYSNSNKKTYAVMLYDSINSKVESIDYMLPGYDIINALSPIHYRPNDGGAIYNAANIHFGLNHYIMMTPIFTTTTYTATRKRTRTAITGSDGSITSYEYGEWGSWTPSSATTITLNIDAQDITFGYTIANNQSLPSNSSLQLSDNGTQLNSQRTIETWSLVLNELTTIYSGFDTNYFSQCKLDNMFNTEILSISNGNAFRLSNNFVYSTSQLNNVSNYLIRWDNDTNLMGINRDLMIGTLPINNNNVHYISNTNNMSINLGSISNPDATFSGYNNVTFISNN